MAGLEQIKEAFMNHNNKIIENMEEIMSMGKRHWKMKATEYFLYLPKFFLLWLLLIMMMGCGYIDKPETIDTVNVEFDNEETNKPLELTELNDDVIDNEQNNIEKTYAIYQFALEAYNNGEYLDAYLNLKSIDENDLLQMPSYEIGQIDEIIKLCTTNFEELGANAFANGDYNTSYQYWNAVSEWNEFINKKCYNCLCSGGIYRMVQGVWYANEQIGDSYIKIEGTNIEVIGQDCMFLSPGHYTYKIVFFDETGVAGSLVLNDADVIIQKGITGGQILLYPSNGHGEYSDRTKYQKYYNDVTIDNKDYTDNSNKFGNNNENIVKKEPYIGMTKEQLIDLSWGEPEKKNVTEFSFGKYEQWCYSSYRYVYLENGVVTAIQYSE